MEYLPVIADQPNLHVCKEFLDFAIEVLNDLEITNIFVHADEKVYANLIRFIWKYPHLYKQITPVMGGFHSLKVKLRF